MAWKVFGEGREVDFPLVLGAIKSNIGHTEGAAGVIGVIKATLALQHQQVPPNLHLSKRNPGLELEGFAVQLPGSVEALPGREGALPLAGISSFGYSGTNAHCILEGGALLAGALDEPNLKPEYVPM